MDPVTHTLTGFMIHRAGVARGVPYAPLVMMLAASVPDIDIVAALGGSELYFRYHRWATHAIVAIPLMALLPVLLVRFTFARGKPFQWRQLYLGSLVAAASHPLLDFTNPYGIRLFWPFQDTWPALEISYVVDILVMAALLIGAAGPALSWLVGSEIGAKPKPNAGRASAVVVLTLYALIAGGRWFLHQRAITLQTAWNYHGLPALRAGAFPSLFNPFSWVGVVETERFFVVQPVDLLGEFDPTAGKIHFKPEAANPAIDAALRTPLFQDLRRFSPFVLLRATPTDDPDLTEIQAMELRFAQPPGAGFTATAVVDSKGVVRRTAWKF